MVLYRCPVPRCLLVLKNRTGYTQHLRRRHPEWNGNSEFPDLLVPHDNSEDESEEDTVDDNGFQDDKPYTTPIQRQRAQARQQWVSESTYVCLFHMLVVR